MSAGERKAGVRRFNKLSEVCWRTGYVDILDEIPAPNFIFHSPGAPPGLGGFKQSLFVFGATGVRGFNDAGHLLLRG